MVRHAVLLALLVALFAAPLAHAAPPTEPSLRRAAPPALINARPADDARAIDRGLARAVKAKRLTKSQAAHYRAILANARKTLRGLPAGRATTLARVLRLVRLQANAFTKPRSLAVFSMLDFNARYLKKRGLPASGTDVAGPHGVVYRAGWGYGLQFHPLANVGALNVHAAAGRTKQAKALAEALIDRMVPRKQGAVWEYYFPFGGGSPPWTSGMAQAVGAQALGRAGKMTAARRAFGSIPGPLVQRLGAGPWIRLYAFSNLVVLNAQLQTILSLREYAEASGNKRASQFATNLAKTARAKLSEFDTGYWSRYSLGQESSLSYHEYVVGLLGRLARRTGQKVWQDKHDRFDAYTDQAPVLKKGDRQARFYPWPSDGFRDRVTIGFWLSKMSSVTVRVGGDELRLGTLTGGWHRISWSTSKRKPRTFTPTADARDLAGNKGSAPLAPIVLARDTTAPTVKASVKKRTLRWKATDAETPWVRLRVRLTRKGAHKDLWLGVRPLAGSARLQLPRGTWQARLIVRDSSGNTAAPVPLGPVPRAK